VSVAGGVVGATGRGRCVSIDSRGPAPRSFAGQGDKPQAPRLRKEAAWMLSGNGLALVFQAAYFVMMGRMLGSREYGALVGVVALVGSLGQLSSVGMEMVLLRNVSRDRDSFGETWGRALVVSAAGAVALLVLSVAYAHWFLPASLRPLVPWIALADGLLGKLIQLGSRALQGANDAARSARLNALGNGGRTVTAAVLLLLAHTMHRQVGALGWVHVYWIGSAAVAAYGGWTVTRVLGLPRFVRFGWREAFEGVPFSLSSSAISIYNDLDKTLLVSMGMSYAAGIYGAAYRVIDVLSTPVYSLYAAATPRFFREGAAGVSGVVRLSRRMLSWTLPFGLLAAVGVVVGAPVMPWAFGRSFGGSMAVLQWLCLLPLIRGVQYAFGTAITASSSQWLRTATQAGAAGVNLGLNLVLIPRWGWQGAALASLLTDAGLAVSNIAVVWWLLRREARTTTDGAPVLVAG
jgi:O-antigen/teichoic acid export membrane protein